ncbi:MAG TPA: outer membrane beta-barrel protein [Woeseiaceae bacterium]|nr:outer membrane beta-barrel protein [Woeseiaceae bacterium]
MKKSVLAGLALAICALSSTAFADTPSFNYLQTGVQHTNTSAGNNWGWGVEGSFNPVGGLFFSGDYSRTNYIQSAQSDLETYRADVGYEVDFLDALAAYGEAGWAVSQVSGNRSDGAHVEVGLRANVLSVLELRGAVGHYNRDGGFNEYSGAILFHFVPFTSVSVGYVKDQASASNGSYNRWQVGLRWSF